jgi:hypothetical protein
MINPRLETVGTILTITDVTLGKEVLPFYSSRGITQTMTPIDAAESQRRTVNGELVDLSLSRMRKYSSVISARDVRPPSRDDVWPGRKVYVGCAYLLSYPTSGGSPSRDVLSGSSFAEGNFTFYRPVIQFMIGRASGSFEEWQAGYQWSIPMQEV